MKVPFQLLFDLGVADKISSCSYRRNEYAYLEEDADLSTFIKALGFEPKTKNHTCDSSSIKNYLPYATDGFYAVGEIRGRRVVGRMLAMRVSLQEALKLVKLHGFGKIVEVA